VPSPSCAASPSPIETAGGSRHANAGPTILAGYRLFVVCGCGAEFKRWVTPEDGDEDLLRSALLAFEN